MSAQAPASVTDWLLMLDDTLLRPPHRYVYFLGAPAQRRHNRKACKFAALPYPKADPLP